MKDGFPQMGKFFRGRPGLARSSFLGVYRLPLRTQIQISVYFPFTAFLAADELRLVESWLHQILSNAVDLRLRWWVYYRCHGVNAFVHLVPFQRVSGGLLLN